VDVEALLVTRYCNAIPRVYPIFAEHRGSDSRGLALPKNNAERLDSQKTRMEIRPSYSRRTSFPFLSTAAPALAPSMTINPCSYAIEPPTS